MPVNPVAMAQLLEAEDGQVGRLVAAYAAIVRDLARQNAGDIMHSMPEPDLSIMLESIDFEQNGTEATVGIEDLGEIETYLATKELREQVWLLPAAAETFSLDNQAAVTTLLAGLSR